MHRWVALLALVVPLVACGGAAQQAALEMPEGIEEAGDASIAVLRRPIGDAVVVSMFLDAGSRDANPPAVATLAAWTAGEASAIATRVFPDATQLTTSCERSEIGSCVARLARALGTRVVDASALTRARERLVEARRSAASDEREAQRIALTSLLGEEAQRLEPLGAAEDDDALTREAVERFLATHYGPSRALFIATGEVTYAELGEEVERELRRSRPATGGRVTRTLATEGDHELRLAIGDASHVALATRAASVDDAARIAASLAGSLQRVGALTVHAFPLRGGAIAIASGEARRSSLRDAAFEVGFELARAQAGDVSARPVADASDDPGLAALQLGLGWAAAGDAEASAPTFGVGVVVVGGRDDAARASAQSDRIRAQLVRSFADGQTRASAETRGTSTDRGASVVATNGARIEIERREGAARVAIVARYEGGSAIDVASAHGETALLAALGATACHGLAADELAERLRGLGATLAPFVEPRAFGIVLDAPAEHAEEAIAIAADCATRPAIDSPSLERARLAASTLAATDSARRAAFVAEAISSAHPGMLAPSGTERGIARATLATVRDAIRSREVGARLAIAVVGDVEPEVVTRAIARRVHRLEAGAAPIIEDPTIEPGSIVAHDATIRTVAAITLHVQFEAPSPLAVRAVALELEGALASFREVQRAEAFAFAGERTATVVVAIDATSDIALRLPTIAAQAIAQARARVDARLDHAIVEDGLAGARSAVAAMRLARRRQERAEGDAASTASALLGAEPSFVLGRPRD